MPKRDRVIVGEICPGLYALEHMCGLLTKFREHPYFVCTSSHRRLVLGSVPRLTHPFGHEKGG